MDQFMICRHKSGELLQNWGCTPDQSLKPSLNMMQLSEQVPQEIGEVKGEHTYVWSMDNGLLPLACLVY